MLIFCVIIYLFNLRKDTFGMNERANAFHNEKKYDQSKECNNYSGKITKSGPSLSYDLPYTPKFMSRLDRSCRLESFQSGNLYWYSISTTCNSALSGA